jgi:hypothetical protein
VPAAPTVTAAGPVSSPAAPAQTSAPAASAPTPAPIAPQPVGRARPSTRVVVVPRRARSTSARRARPILARVRLSRRAFVRISVWEQAPACRFVGRYRVRAQKGSNVLRLRRHIGSKQLRAGTYEFVGLALGRTVLSVRIRFAARDNRLLAVHRTKLHAACSSTGGGVTGVELAATSPTGSSGGGTAQRQRAAKSSTGGGTRSASGPQGAPFRPPTQSTTPPGLASARSAVPLFVLLSLAIALLAAATVPERVPAGAAVSRHRPFVAVGGLALLLAAAILLFA